MIWSLESITDESESSTTVVPSLVPTFAHHFNDNNESILVAPNDSNSICVLKDGLLLHQSPQDSSLITCVAFSCKQDVVAYGCMNGSIRLYFPHSQAVKTLGNHATKITSLDVSIEIEVKLHSRQLTYLLN